MSFFTANSTLSSNLITEIPTEKSFKSSIYCNSQEFLNTNNVKPRNDKLFVSSFSSDLHDMHIN